MSDWASSGLVWRGKAVGTLSRDELGEALVEALRRVGPTDDALGALIRVAWLSARPGREAQSIRGSLSNAFDDARFPSWVSDYIPDYVWDLVDIAAQRGFELGRKGEGDG